MGWRNLLLPCRAEGCQVDEIRSRASVWNEKWRLHDVQAYPDGAGHAVLISMEQRNDSIGIHIEHEGTVRVKDVQYRVLDERRGRAAVGARRVVLSGGVAGEGHEEVVASLADLLLVSLLSAVLAPDIRTMVLTIPLTSIVMIVLVVGTVFVLFLSL